MMMYSKEKIHIEPPVLTIKIKGGIQAIKSTTTTDE